MTPPIDSRHQASGTIVLTCVLSCLVAAFWTVTSIHSSQLGWDFPVFYIAGHLPSSALYNADSFADFWSTHLRVQGVRHWAPYVRLPIFALPLRQLLNLPYYPAFYCWLACGSVCYLTALVLLLRRLHLPLLLIPACLAFFPAAVGIIAGSDIGFQFLLIVLLFELLERDCQFLAGTALTLCLCKYNLVILIPLMLLVKQRYRVLCSFLTGSLVVFASSAFLASPAAYLHALRNAPALSGRFDPVGLLGFCLAIGVPAAYAPLALLTVLLCCYLFYHLDSGSALAAAMVGTLMISPYVTWYDSTLLVLPILVVCCQGQRGIQWLCGITLAALPLWVLGGGYNGPIGFTHILVECLLLSWFVFQTQRRIVVKRCGGHARIDQFRGLEPLTLQR